MNYKNYRYFLFTISLLLVMSFGCKEKLSPKFSEVSGKLSEAKLVYVVSGEGKSNWEFQVLFDETGVLIDEKFAGSASKKFILDKSSNEILGLITEAQLFTGKITDQYFFYYTPETLINSALSSNYGDTIVTRTNESKDILGYTCYKTIINHGEQAVVEIWTTEEIKPGVIYPWTPLVFDEIALEYELKVLGNTERKYEIGSIEKLEKDESDFIQVVPDEFHLIVPATVYSVDSVWSNRFNEENFESFSYPYISQGRDSTLKILKNRILEVIETDDTELKQIQFMVNKEGFIDQVFVNYGRKSKISENALRMLQNLPQWTPGKVKGEPVNSQVTIYI